MKHTMSTLLSEELCLNKAKALTAASDPIDAAIDLLCAHVRGRDLEKFGDPRISKLTLKMLSTRGSISFLLVMVTVSKDVVMLPKARMPHAENRVAVLMGCLAMRAVRIRNADCMVLVCGVIWI